MLKNRGSRMDENIAIMMTVLKLVLKSQIEAIEMVKPGANIEAIHKRVIEVLSQGLIDLGFFDGPVEEVIEKGEFKKFFMHGTSHWLGLGPDLWFLQQDAKIIN